MAIICVGPFVPSDILTIPIGTKINLEHRVEPHEVVSPQPKAGRAKKDGIEERERERENYNGS